jgi:L-threonylcarbamoyladenylate synthase
MPIGFTQALAALRRPGGVVLYPTETVYGLGGRAGDAASALRIARIKGRSPGGLIVLALDPPLSQPLARALAAKLWPGPLTLVVPAWPGLPEEILGPDGTVAVRPPLHPVALALVEGVGPITSTSANATGQPPVSDPRRCSLPVDAVLDVGPLPLSAPSSIVRGADGSILREGAISRAVIEAVLADMRG